MPKRYEYIAESANTLSFSNPIFSVRDAKRGIHNHEIPLILVLIDPALRRVSVRCDYSGRSIAGFRRRLIFELQVILPMYGWVFAFLPRVRQVLLGARNDTASRVWIL